MMSLKTAVIFAAMLPFLAFQFAIAAEPDRPNIVLILADDIGYNDYGFMGNSNVRTPNLDRLAKESLCFTRGYVPTSLCRPSLASLITGLYPHQHLITGNDPPKGTPREEMLTRIAAIDPLPKILGKSGYKSLQTGKWWEGNHTVGGFTHGMTHGDPKKGGRHGDLGLKIGRDGLQPIEEFLTTHGKEPFYLWYAPMLPHQPHNPPERLLEKYRGKTDSLHIAKYWAMIEWWDETCGELLALLEKTGKADNTLIAYIADNGWIQNPNQPKHDERSKRSPYDGGLRSPILIRWPAKVKPQRDEESLASGIDLVPTMLAAAGMKPPLELPGVNLLDAASLASRKILFAETFSHDVPDLADPTAGLLARCAIERQYKLIVPVGTEPPMLFDLDRDPEERMNLAQERPAEVTRLSAQLDAWWKPKTVAP